MRSAAIAALALLLPRIAAAQFPAELTGQVVDSTTGEPIAGARIEVPSAGVTTTDASGWFRVRGVAPGQWEFTVGAIGYRVTRRSVFAVDGQVERVMIALNREAVRLAPVKVEAPNQAADVGATIIGPAEIQRAVSPTLPALLAGQPGVTITQGGPGSPATASIRGSSAHEVLVLLDGVPLNDPTSGSADLSTVPIEQIERVTIIRGAAAARYGPRALAGVILIERRHPTETEASLTLSQGQWGDRSARGSVTAAQRSDSRVVAATIGGTIADAEGDFRYTQPAVRGGGSARRTNADAANRSLLGSARVQEGGSHIEIRGDLLRLDRGLPGSVVQPNPEARETDHRTGAGLSVGHARGSFQLTADGQVMDEKVHYVDLHPPTGGPYNDSLHVRQLQGTLGAATAIGPAHASAGFEMQSLALEASSLTNQAPPVQHIVGAWTQLAVERRVRRGTVEFSTGIRYDRNDRLGGGRLSPTVVLRVPVPGMNVQVAWGMAYAPPTLADQFFQPGILARPNPNLQPERVRSDLRAQFSTAPIGVGRTRVDATLALFQADIDGTIIWFPDFRFVWSPDNYDIRRAGAELSGQVVLPVAQLTLGASLSDVAVRYRGPVLSGQVAYRPRTTANASLSASLGGIRPVVRYRFVGRRRTVPSSALNTLDPFAMVDLQLGRRIVWSRASVELAASLDDALNGGGAMLIDYPSSGRTWRLTATMRAGGVSHANR